MGELRPDEATKRLLVALDAHMPVPDDVAEWLSSGLVRFQHGEEKTLCRALELRVPGRLGNPEYRRSLDRRNQALCEAADLMPEPTPYQRAAALANEARAFETRVWPRVADLPEPPERLTPVQAALWRAFRAYDRVPATTEGIYACLK